MTARRVTPILSLLFALVVPLPGQGATPASGTLTDTSGPIGYSAGPFVGANPTPLPLVDAGPECLDPVQPCDSYALTVNVSSGYLTQHPGAFVRVTLGWTDTGTGNSDYDLYVFSGVVGDTDGGKSADAQGGGGDNPEIATVAPLFAGPRVYTIKIVPFTPTAEIVNVTIELQPGTGGPPSTFGGPDPAQPGVPRYQNYYAPAGSSAEVGSGEFNIGFNPATRRIMAMNSGPIWRLTPAEVVNAANPESCEALWEEKSSISTDVGVDPILWTDQKTGVTVASNSTAGANALFAFTLNDGDIWVPLSISPVNGGTDHETLGSGPYPASLSALGNPVNKGQAMYYCSQTWPLGPGACQRSDDLGATFGPGVLAYQGNGLTQCEGIHGHVHVANDGTVWLPLRDCGGIQGGVISTDAGVNWSEFAVSGSRSQSVGADPSIALDENNTAYFCYVNDEPVAEGAPAEGHVHVKVSHDRGQTWINDVDLGASHGIKNAAHPEAVGGSAGRAACGFIGTNTAGDYQSVSFPGVWYAFIATTYDGGQTWTTVNASPNDPVQRASGIWQGGGSHTNRNLLDFNEITLDDKGRVLYGYSDGCVTEGCIAGTQANDFVADMRVARQTGGKSLYAQFDAAEPFAPKRACLAGERDNTGSTLSWKVPDHGGSAISSYQILRGTSAGQGTPIATVLGAKSSFTDISADPSVATYYYTVKAVNGSGTGAASNEIALTKTVGPPPGNVCALPGLPELSDDSGDTSPVTGIIGGVSVSTPAGPGTDLLAVHLAQPYQPNGGASKLVFTIDTDPGQSPQPPNTAWYVSMKIQDPAPAITFHYRAVRMFWNGSTPVFESYTPSTSNAGTTDGRFVVAGSNKPADASSSYAAPYDKVVIVVKASDLGLNPGDTITGFVSAVSYSAVAISGLFDAMPDSLNYGGGPYTVGGSQSCRPNTAPLAALAAAPLSGQAPLTVHFVGAGSDADTDPPADTIASYTFDFGDGSAPVTQAGTSIDHTYTAAFSYNARLTVTDSRGKASVNEARQDIMVTAAADLTLSKTHAGDFTQGQKGAKYTITVRNSGGAASAGQVAATDTLPAALTATAISGSGWTCTLSPLRCTRSDALAAGASYPPITLTVNVANNAPATVTNTASVSGGGESNTGNDGASDPTNVKKKK